MSAVDCSVSSSDEPFLVANENAVSLASATRVTDGAASLAAMSRIAATRLGPVREQVAEDRALRRQAPDLDRRLADDPEPAL